MFLPAWRRRRPDLRRDCDGLVAVFGYRCPDDEDLIYEGIATQYGGVLFRSRQFFADDEDLIYEGIATIRIRNRIDVVKTTKT